MPASTCGSTSDEKCDLGDGCQGEKLARGGSGYLHCCLCKASFHFGCVGISSSARPPKAMFDLLQSNFACDSCKASSRNAVATGLGNLERTVADGFAAVFQRLETLECKEIDFDKSVDEPAVENFDDQIDLDHQLTAPATYAQAAWRTVGKRRRSGRSAVKVAEAKEQLREEKEDESRERSLIVRGLRENGNDFKDVGYIIREIDYSLEPNHIFTCYRMGKEERDHPRLLKVIFVSSHVQKAVLRNAARLKNHPELRNIYLRRSMSEAERGDRKHLQMHCQKLNKKASSGTKYVLQADGDKVKLCRYVNCKTDSQTGVLYGGTLSTDPIPPPTPKKPKVAQVHNTAAINIVPDSVDGGLQATQSASQGN